MPMVVDLQAPLGPSNVEVTLLYIQIDTFERLESLA